MSTNNDDNEGLLPSSSSDPQTTNGSSINSDSSSISLENDALEGSAQALPGTTNAPTRAAEETPTVAAEIAETTTEAEATTAAAAAAAAATTRSPIQSRSPRVNQSRRPRRPRRTPANDADAAQKEAIKAERRAQLLQNAAQQDEEEEEQDDQQRQTGDELANNNNNNNNLRTVTRQQQPQLQGSNGNNRNATSRRIPGTQRPPKVSGGGGAGGAPTQVGAVAATGRAYGAPRRLQPGNLTQSLVMDEPLVLSSSQELQKGSSRQLLNTEASTSCYKTNMATPPNSSFSSPPSSSQQINIRNLSSSGTSVQARAIDCDDEEEVENERIRQLEAQVAELTQKRSLQDSTTACSPRSSYVDSFRVQVLGKKKKSPGGGFCDRNDGMEEEEEGYYQSCWARSKIPIVAILSLLLGGSLAAYFFGQDKEQSLANAADMAVSPTLAPSSAPTMPIPTLWRVPGQEEPMNRRDYLESLLSPRHAPLKRAAIEWLINVDTFEPFLPLDYDKVFEERYAMAVLLLSLSPSSVNKNSTGIELLETRRGETCTWDGVQCAPPPLISRLDLGTVLSSDLSLCYLLLQTEHCV